MQRGSFDSPGQFKTQIDHGVPSCRVLGDESEVFVKAGKSVSPEVWYAVACERSGDRVSISVTQYGEQGQSWSADGPTGHISIRRPAARNRREGERRRAPDASGDQFNGAVDDVFLEIG